MAESSATILRSHIEGGVEAVVLGATLDGLVAATYLARAGLKTVLLEASGELGGAIAPRKFGSRFEGADGEHLIFALDPAMIDDLDLYRNGLEFAMRRLDSVYCFDDGDMLQLHGDIKTPPDIDDDGAAAYQTFISEVLEAAEFLRPMLAGPPAASKDFSKALSLAPPELVERLRAYWVRPAESILENRFTNEKLHTALRTEASFFNAVPLHEPTSFSALLSRWAGESAGLQAGYGYVKGGSVSLIQALRRAAQRAKVDIRTASPVSEILIEQDSVAGVTLENGGQVRAPLVVSALDANRTFLSLIGAVSLDRQFQRALSAPRAKIGRAQYHIELDGAPRDEETRSKLRQRVVFAPTPDDLRRAFHEAGDGKIPDELVVEAIFINALEDENDVSEHQYLSVFAHPIPVLPSYDDAMREAIDKAILQGLEKIAPKIGERIDESALVLPSDLAAHARMPVEVLALKPGLVQQLALAAATTSAGDIGGLYFCGPEAQLGAGLNGAAGRNAAAAALQRSDRAGVAP